MTQPVLQRNFMSGWRRWMVITFAFGLVVAIILSLALWRQATMAVAKDCGRETPLPTDVRLITPGADVPEAVAQFAGVWTGVWRPRGLTAIYVLLRYLVRGQRFEPLCHTLVVEEVLPNGYARAILSVGSSAYWDVHWPVFGRVTLRIIDGALPYQQPDGLKLTYRMAGETLQGPIEFPDGGTGHGHLTRVADLRQVGCRAQAGKLPPAPSAGGPRDRLTSGELLQATDAGPGPVHNAYFMPVGQSAPALHAFKGTLTVEASSMFQARYGCTGPVEALPSSSATFFTHGEYLVPVVRDSLQLPGIILSPGRVWSEPGDQGMSRASFPFVLTNPYNNGTHNGLATFLYDDTRVSALRFQVVQETAAWAKDDDWGQAAMSYTPGPIANEETLRAQFAAELQQQTPIRPWSALRVSSGAEWLERFDGDTAPEDVSASGLIVDGIIYLRGCETRYGPYPYCREMRHGAFSVTKSLGAAVALLRLAQTYGEQVFALKIKDYVTVTAAHDGWEGVTVAHVLNMATGVGDLAPQREPNEVFADENKPRMNQWERARTAQAKLDVSFSYGQYPWGPGEVLRYNCTHTFVLAAAMDSFLKRQAGPQAHLWDMVVAEVFRPIGIFQAPMMHTQEVDGGRGIPLLCVGLYPTIDDVAKLTALLQHGGRHQGQQLLHAGKLAEALYKTNAMGLPNNSGENRFGVGRYQLSFWSVPYRTASGCSFQIPYMSGFGGNVVVLLPNGISAFRFADGHHYDVDTMVLAGEAVRPFPCPSGSEEAPPYERQPLSASEVHAELPGNTLYLDPVHMVSLLDSNIFLAPGGVLYGTFKTGSDTDTSHDAGRWHITPGGYFCRTWFVWDNRRERCFAVYREGETFELHQTDGFGKEAYRRAPGNPEGY